MEGIRLRDLPSVIRTTDKDDIMLNFFIKMIEKARDASAILFNSFDDLEPQALRGISSTYTASTFSIGPLHLHLNRFSNSSVDSIGSNLWKEESGCLEWLDSREPNSVLYVNFGSIAVLTKQQLVELAWGLANSGKAFFWVIRPDLVMGESAILPADFVANTKGRGFLASWCAQEKVLGHGSVAGFLTHCGWNSMLESMSAGVPMLCWPFFGDQPPNCWFACKKWGVGLEIYDGVGSSEIEKLVRKFMEGNEGKQMKAAAMEWKRIAENTVTHPNGSSSLNFEQMVEQVILKKGR